jgi:hypothetical protein
MPYQSISSDGPDSGRGGHCARIAVQEIVVAAGRMRSWGRFAYCAGLDSVDGLGLRYLVGSTTLHNFTLYQD